jgi:hypothetical protein
VTKPAQSYTFEFKLAPVERFVARETAPDLAAEVGFACLTKHVSACVSSRRR